MKILLALVLLVAACSPVAGFHCATDSQCDLVAGEQCIANACAERDGTCSSALRWTMTAGPRAGVCASLVAGTDAGDASSEVLNDDRPTTDASLVDEADAGQDASPLQDADICLPTTCTSPTYTHCDGNGGVALCCRGPVLACIDCHPGETCDPMAHFCCTPAPGT